MINRRATLKGLACAALLPIALKGVSIPEPTQYKLGKLPASKSVKLKLPDYLTKLPAIPDDFGHDPLVQRWGVFKNDVLGDCVIAGAAHEHMLWSAEGNVPCAFDDASVVRAYSAITGYDPSQTDPLGNNPTDQGTDVGQALRFRQQAGITDAAGNVHRLGAYAEIPLGRLDMLAAATYLFSATAVGIGFPSSAMSQFHAGRPWDVVPNAQLIGGHYVPILGRHNGYFVCVTWGKLQLITPRFLSYYMDECYAIWSPEFLNAGKSPEGFDQPALVADMKGVTSP